MIVLGCFLPLGCLSAGARGGNQSVQWEQEPPEAAGRAASEGRRLAAGGQPALAQPLPAHRSQVRSRRAQVVKETILRCALQLSGVLLTSPPPPPQRADGESRSPQKLPAHPGIAATPARLFRPSAICLCVHALSHWDSTGGCRLCPHALFTQE